MAINFNKDSVFDLTPITRDYVYKEVDDLLIDDEKICAAFKTFRDQLVFTTHRIISVDVQGLTGKKVSYTSLPYSKIQFFSIQTPGFAELVPDSELMITFTSGFNATFEFKGNTNIGGIGRLISRYVLSKN